MLSLLSCTSVPGRGDRESVSSLYPTALLLSSVPRAEGATYSQAGVTVSPHMTSSGFQGFEERTPTERGC